MQQSIQQDLNRLGYNMLNTDLTAKRCVENPGKECAAIKKLSHDALFTGRSNILADNYEAANSNFAYAYQMRCVSDYIWCNLMHNSGDNGHAAYLQLSRDFGMLAANKRILTSEQKTNILKQIERISLR